MLTFPRRVRGAAAHGARTFLNGMAAAVRAPWYSALLLSIYLLPVALWPLPFHPLDRVDTVFLAYVAYLAGRTRPLHTLARESWLRVFVGPAPKGPWRFRLWGYLFVATHPESWPSFIRIVILRRPVHAPEPASGINDPIRVADNVGPKVPPAREAAE